MWEALFTSLGSWLYFINFSITGSGDFIKTLINFDKENMSDRVLKKVGTYCAQADFQPEIVGRVSLAARSLCMWCRAMEVYGRIYRVVEPKKQRLANATSQLEEKQKVLAEARAKLKEVRRQRYWIKFLHLTLDKKADLIKSPCLSILSSFFHYCWFSLKITSFQVCLENWFKYFYLFCGYF